MANRYFSLRVLWLPLLVVAAVLLSGYYLTKSPTHKNTGESLAAFLSAPGNASFEQVTPDRTLVFPKDHGPHTGFRQEWWYFVGNLRDASGNRYGFQLTFFASPTVKHVLMLVILHGIPDTTGWRIWRLPTSANAASLPPKIFRGRHWNSLAPLMPHLVFG